MCSCLKCIIWWLGFLLTRLPWRAHQAAVTHWLEYPGNAMAGMYVTTRKRRSVQTMGPYQRGAFSPSLSRLLMISPCLNARPRVTICQQWRLMSLYVSGVSWMYLVFNCGNFLQKNEYMLNNYTCLTFWVYIDVIKVDLTYLNYNFTRA